MLRVAVDCGGRARIVCEVARTAVEQARGLQDHPGLRDGTGMLFPFHPPRAATFHMGRVAFPIDVVFTDASGVVQRIVHAAQPGERSTWSHPVVGAVVEVPGGWCGAVGLGVGDVVQVAGRKLGAQTYNLLRTLTEAEVEAGSLGEPRGEDEADGFDVHADPPPFQDGYYSKEPQHAPPDYGGERDDLLTPAQDDEGWPSGGDGRYNDRTLPDRDPDAMQQPNDNWSQAMPYVVPLDAPEPLGGTRMGRRTAAPWRDDTADYPERTEADWAEARRRFRERCIEIGWIGQRTAGALDDYMRRLLKLSDDSMSFSTANEWKSGKHEQTGRMLLRLTLSDGTVLDEPIDPESDLRAEGMALLERARRRQARLELARVRFRTKAAEVLAAKEAQRVQVQLEELVPRVMAGALRVGIPWETVVLNDKREQAVITPTVVGEWLHALGLSEEARSMTWQAATTPQALDALATALISEKMADTANIAHLGDQNILVVTRRRH